MDFFLDSSLFDGPVLIVLYSMVAAGALLLLTTPGSVRRVRTRLVGLAVGAVGGVILTWLIADWLDLFGFAPTMVMRIWLAGVGAGLGLLAVVIRQGPLWQRIVAGLLVPFLLLAGAAAINVEFGQFPTLRVLLGLSQVPPLAVPSAGTARTVLPSAGSLGSVTIPARVSKFPARQGVVYLPPVALIANAPALPVLVMLAGQPGSPSDIFTAGRLGAILNDYAQKNGGYAPIVVVPDQLGSPTANPMCVDGPLGNSASYLTVDVPNWIRANLNVLKDRRAWTIGGFSQGGTCSSQLGAAYPEIFGNILDIAGERVPSLGTEQATIDRGFRGSRDAYLAATPERILARKAPYADSTAIFAAGANDAVFRGYASTLAAAAQAAGIRASYLESPGTAHDWGTVQYVARLAVPILMQRAEARAK